jgi:hypothetical protein
MFEALENRTNIVCGGLFLAIVVLGKMFGGTLYGLIPLALCIASGIFLWMKEVVRSGRAKEWSSERDRGQMISDQVKLLSTQANSH